MNKNEKLAIQIDTAVKSSKPADWRGHQARENVIKKEVYDLLLKNQSDGNSFSVKEPQTIYSHDKIALEVERIFDVIKQQNEY